MGFNKNNRYFLLDKINMMILFTPKIINHKLEITIIQKQENHSKIHLNKVIA